MDIIFLFLAGAFIFYLIIHFIFGKGWFVNSIVVLTSGISVWFSSYIDSSFGQTFLVITFGAILFSCLVKLLFWFYIFLVGEAGLLEQSIRKAIRGEIKKEIKKEKRDDKEQES